MTVIDRSQDVEGTSPLVVPEAIIREARWRERRRRAISTLVVIGSIGAVAAVAVLGLRNSRAILVKSRPPLGPGQRSASGGLPDAVVAWADYTGVLHLGDLATRRQLQIVTHPSVEVFTDPAAVDGKRLLWVDAKGRVRSIQLATGRVGVVARGTAVMASPDRGPLYVDQGTRDFLELDARTLRVTRRAALPAAWRTSPWVAQPVAGGLLLTHSGKQSALGIWRPGGKVRPLGTATATATDTALGVHTSPTGGALVAWLPKCANHSAGLGSGCPLAITDTATGRTVTVASPTRYGFTGGAFSPDGSQFATFVNTDNPTNPFSAPRSELAIVNTATGSLRLDAKVKMITTEDAAWALWLPPGRQLLTGAISATYLVNAHSLATRPFYFDGDATRMESVMSSPDLNFSTLVVSPSALSPKQRQLLGLPQLTRDGDKR